ncbi:6-hydroxymethylpterin diphosphokinase MptE-like protein [Paenibacillus protaetiae]|uniref:DUF115 domain-containing protein n=1 Tax=Paenibacillus protaetiae TaxID=2509456 RepID=A0A4P6EXI6_9BACL|nr:6-hydroxymethylpterin diphosphokinase MptE-like protein [Paenibacillus protaetiae]QAY67762.1 DUF115 domain-containing protein [Paenibacillus protaetiae]
MEQKSLQEGINAILMDIKHFLPDLIAACEVVEPMFYSTPDDNTWQQFGEIVEGIDDLYRTLNTVSSELGQPTAYSVLQKDIQEAAAQLERHFQRLNDYVDQEDYTGVSDSIYGEFIPFFRRLYNQLGESAADCNSRFERNMRFLEQRFPAVYAEVNGCIPDDSEFGHYQISYNHDGTPNVRVAANDAAVFLYSRYNTAREVKLWLNTLPDGDAHTSALFYGFGLGYHLQAYAQTYPHRRLSVYEPDTVLFRTAMQVVELEQLCQSIDLADLVVGSGKAERDRMFFRFLKYLKGEPALLALPVYNRLYAAEASQFAKDAQYAIFNYYSGLKTYKRFGLEWLTNSLYNLKATLTTPSIKGLKHKLNGVTAVIVGAGPSLEADIESLRALKDHAFIIAAGSSIQSLLHYGIEPHLIVSMDGGEPNYAAFKGLNYQHIPLLYTPMIKYRIIDEKPERLIHVHFSNDAATRHMMEWTDEDVIFTPNHSVTGTAIQAAIYMGCKRIVFTGQDLSYPNDQFYAPGARHASEEILSSLIDHAQLTIENVNGTFNRTNNGMRTTLADIEDLLAEHPDIEFMNTSSMGAKIKHTVWLPMRDVVEQLGESSFDFALFLRELGSLQLYDEERVAQIAAKAAQLPQNVKDCQHHLERILNSLKQTLSLGSTNEQKCRELFAEMDVLWGQVVSSPAFMSVYFLLFRNEFSQFERDLPELLHEEQMLKKAELAKEIFQPLIQAMLERTPELLAITEECKRRVQEAFAGTVQEDKKIGK